MVHQPVVILVSHKQVIIVSISILVFHGFVLSINVYLKTEEFSWIILIFRSAIIHLLL